MAYTDTYSPSRDAVITSALRKLGVVRQGGVPTAEQINEGQEGLNVILKELSALFKHQWLMASTDVTLINSTTTYDLSLISPVIDRLISAFYISSLSVKTSVEVVDINKFHSQPPTTSLPTTMLYLDNSFNATNQSWGVIINIFPTPTGVTTDKIKLIYRGQIRVPNAALDKLQLPYNMYRYVIIRLAADLAHEYGVSVNELGLLEKKAMSALEFLLRDYKATSVDMRDHRFNARYQQTGAIDANVEE